MALADASTPDEGPESDSVSDDEQENRAQNDKKTNASSNETDRPLLSTRAKYMVFGSLVVICAAVFYGGTSISEAERQLNVMSASKEHLVIPERKPDAKRLHLNEKEHHFEAPLAPGILRLPVAGEEEQLYTLCKQVLEQPLVQPLVAGFYLEVKLKLGADYTGRRFEIVIGQKGNTIMDSVVIYYAAFEKTKTLRLSSYDSAHTKVKQETRKEHGYTANEETILRFTLKAPNEWEITKNGKDGISYKFENTFEATSIIISGYVEVKNLDTYWPITSREVLKKTNAIDWPLTHQTFFKDKVR